MEKEQILDFTRRISQSNRSGLSVINFEIIFAYLDDAKKAYQERYRQIKSQNCLWDDGHACERIAAAVFEGAKPENPVFLNKTSKIKILVYAGNFENTYQAGEFDEFLKSVDMERFDITLIGTGAEIE